MQTEISNIKSDNVVFRTNLGELDRFCQSMSWFMDDYDRKNTSTNTYIKKLEQEKRALRSDYNTMKEENQTMSTTVSSMKDKLLQVGFFKKPRLGVSHFEFQRTGEHEKVVREHQKQKIRCTGAVPCRNRGKSENPLSFL